MVIRELLIDHHFVYVCSKSKITGVGLILGRLGLWLTLRWDKLHLRYIEHLARYALLGDS